MGDEKTEIHLRVHNRHQSEQPIRHLESRGSERLFHRLYKDWWWVGDFTKIDFTVRDSQGNESEQVCTFDSLENPRILPRVEIVYYPVRACVGGEAAALVDRSASRSSPIRDAFDTVNQYLPEDKFNLFMTVVNNELNASGCVLGVAAIIKTGVWPAMEGTRAVHT
jgi:hypothetical protein